MTLDQKPAATNRALPGQPEQRPSSKTTLSYWESVWRGATPPDPIDPRRGGYFSRLFDTYVRGAFAEISTKDRPFLEVGCGGSRWLPYFSKEFGFAVSGLDYSSVGCDLARQVLVRAGLDGDIRRADLFDPPQEWLRRFDVVGSFGLVEHFMDTSAAVAACAAFLTRGGRIITLVPTMRGMYGLAYRLLNRPVFDVHVPLTTAALAEAHRRAGLEVADCRYLLGLPGVIGEAAPHGRSHSLHAALRVLSSGYFWIEEHLRGIPPNGLTSPYALCIARKP